MDTCDECGRAKPDVECVGGALWCVKCQDYLRAMPPLTEEDYRAMDEMHEHEGC